jgi:hypothetical protein
MAKATPAPKSIATTDTKGVPTCHQVLADGRICRCPALRKQLFCYYHSRQRDRQRNIAVSARRRKSQTLPDLDIAVITSLNLPTPDDPIAIQVCIAGILQAMMTGALSGPLGGRLLYGLHLAKCNYREVDAFKDRHRPDPELAESVPVAATDPEPIPRLEEAAETAAKDNEELDRYAALLEIDELMLPDRNEEPTDDCRHDDDLRTLLGLLDIEQRQKQHLLEELENNSRGFRYVGRRQILREANRQLEKARAASHHPKKSPEKAVTA